VREAFASGRYGARCDEELHDHASGCAACAEVALVTAALAAARLASVRAAPVPRSGLVWWRMQLRARREAEAAAARTVSRAGAGVLASAFGIAVVLLGAMSLGEAGGELASQTGAALLAAMRSSWRLPLLIAVVAWVALAPVAVWLAMTEHGGPS